MSTSRHRHVNLRIERWQRRCVYGALALLTASGVLWLIARYWLRHAGEFGETVSPFEPWSMKVHGAAAMLSLFFVGSVLNGHIRRARKSGRNLVSGWTMIALLLLLTGSGYGLYYLVGESGRPFWSAFHWLLGLGLAALVPLHVMLGRKSRHH
jgi:hypothetical protein